MNEFIWLNIVFLIRMLIIFTIMAKYMHWRGKDNFTFIEKIPYGIFYIVDILYNYLVSFYFLDAPTKYDETISLRCTRYIKEGKGNNPLTYFRYGFAKIIQFITEFSDPGHI